MEIKKIENKNIVLIGKKETVLINPKVWESERIVLLTEKVNLPPYSGKTVVIDGPGEYEVGGVEVEGIRIGEKTMFVVGIDRVRVGIIGRIDEGLTDKKIDKVSELDVLLFEVEMGVAAKEVVGWAKKWGVNYLMPLVEDYQSEKLKKFLDEVDNEGIEKTAVFKVDRDELPDGMEVVLL